MSLIKRSHGELDWPRWMASRGLFDWPASLRDLWEEDDLLRVEEFRDGDTLVVRAEVPGIDPDRDVEITIDDGVLCVRAERREESKSEDAAGYRSEFRYGSFVRRLVLPPGAAEADVTATYTDGILEVRVPVSGERPAATRVAVTKG